MSIVAGVDFGTLSVRVSIFDSARGRLGSGASEYPLLRKKDDPDYATQRHVDHMQALAEATHRAIEAATIDGNAIEAIALDTTGSTMIPVDAHLEPIDDYYLWCDHRAWKEAAEITAAARSRNLAAIDWCGGIYSSEWGFATIPKSAAVSQPRSSTATWWPPRCAASPTRPWFRAVSAPWVTSGCGTRPWAAFHRRTSLPPSIRCSPACAPNSPAATPPQTRSPDISLRLGPPGSACAPASPFPSAPSTRTGTPSAPACAWATWSTWWEPPPASWPLGRSPS